MKGPASSLQWHLSGSSLLCSLCNDLCCNALNYFGDTVLRVVQNALGLAHCHCSAGYIHMFVRNKTTCFA